MKSGIEPNQVAFGLEFEIAEDGTVVNARAQVGLEKANRCVEAVLRATKFSSHSKGTIKITYPLNGDPP